jgi:pimeloyl-ACP methyl ester carboxylesterase
LDAIGAGDQDGAMTYSVGDWQLTRTYDSAGGTVAFDVLGSGPPVVLVHGTPSWSYLWRDVASELASRFTVYTLDLLGYGESEKRPDQDVSLAAQTRILVELLDLWGLEAPCICGHDFGGAITLRLMVLEGRRFHRVALCDAVAIAPWITPFSRHVQRHLEAFQTVPEHIHRQLVATHLRTAIAREMSDAELEPYLRPWLGPVGQAAYYRQVAQFDERYTREIEPRYGEIETPTLVLWGEQDGWLDPAFGRKLAELIPGAELMMVPGGGHFLPEDQPAAVAAALGDFFFAAR